MGVSPAGGNNGVGGSTGGGDLRLPPEEHSRKVHCDKSHYGPVSGGREVSRVTGDQEVVGSRRLGLGGDADGGLGGGMLEGGGGDGQDDGGDGQLICWEDTVANIILGTDPNNPLAYAPGLELHHPIMSMIGGHGGRL